MRKHINRDYTRFKTSNERPDEYIKVQIFSYNPKYTRAYHPILNNLNLNNAVSVNWRSLSCYRSSNKHDPCIVSMDYPVVESGEYRFDLLYEKCDYLYNDAGYDTNKDLIGEYHIGDAVNGLFKFEGVNNVSKRKTVYHDLTEGTYSCSFEIPSNCLFIGLIIRKVEEYWGDNLDSAGSNLLFDKASWNQSDMFNPSELTFNIGYDDSFDYPDNPSGLYLKYRDEVNLEVRDNDGEIRRVFGGYLSSVLPNDDNTELEVSCADRLIDGDNRYVLEQLSIKGGENNFNTNEYSSGMEVNFNNYAEVLRYLCNVYESTLDASIATDYLEGGEKYYEGVNLKYSNKALQESMSVTNGQLSKNKDFVMLRNNSSGVNKQVWTIYDASKVAKKPPALYGVEGGLFQNSGYLHMTYGMGVTKYSHSKKVTTVVDTADVTAGAQKFSEYGVSQDKKYIMAIGRASAKGEEKKYPYKYFYRRIFERKCPECGSTNLVWSIFWTGNETGDYGFCPAVGHKEGGSAEGHIFCKGCDADWSVFGKNHGKGKDLKATTGVKKSSKDDAYKLKNGEMVAIPKNNTTVSPNDIFDAIWKIGKKYSYQRNTASNYADMKQVGKGDCWAFSELIFTELKKYQVNCKIVEYSTNDSGRHRSVLYKNNNNKWVDYPYTWHGWSKMLRPTSKSRTARTVESYTAGSKINQVTVNSSTSKTQTTKITTTKGYDKDNPFQAYFKIFYSNTRSFTAQKKHIYIDFTQQSGSDSAMPSNTPFWVNDTTKELVTDNIVDFIHSFEGEDSEIYLQSIQLVTPKIIVKNHEDKAEWYTNDETNRDESSCKMNLYQIVFNNNKQGNSNDLDSCGQTVNSLFESICKDAGYNCYVDYGRHRVDDKITFELSDQTEVNFTAHEGDATVGDNTHILEWSNIEYKPIESMKNHSVTVFKRKNEQYYFVDTRDMDSILEYGEQTTLITENEVIGSKQAYFMACNNENYNPNQDYSFTIKLANYPNLRLGELVQVLSDAKRLNSVKEVKSRSLEYDINEMPKITSELGLDELAMDLQINKRLREIRRNAKAQTTSFGKKGASPILDDEIYQWDN